MGEQLTQPHGEAILSPDEYRTYFNNRFELYGNSLVQQAADLSPDFERLVDYTMDTMLHSGKRLRPYLAYLAYKGFGGEDDSAVADVSLSLELYHSALLVHDDVMDNDLVRHGTANVMGRYVSDLSTQGLPPEEVSEVARSMAILAGDFLFGLTLGTILDSELPNEQKILFSREFVDLNLYECAGQQLDALLNTLPLGDVKEEHITKLCTYKTAFYTYDRPLRFGALLAGADEDELGALNSFATKVGIAFQITDDVMGIYGDETQIGKPIGSDMREGKKTLLMVRAYHRADQDTRKLLELMLGDKGFGPESMAMLHRLLEDLEVRESVEGTAQELISSAQSDLDRSGLSEEAKERLVAISNKLVGRVV